MAGDPTCFEFDSTGFTLDGTGQTWDQTICPAPPVPRPAPVTIGGIGEYHIQIPREPKKHAPMRHRRNMENQDRADIARIVEMLMKAGIV